jgi:hypothetical protein
VSKYRVRLRFMGTAKERLTGIEPTTFVEIETDASPRPESDEFALAVSKAASEVAVEVAGRREAAPFSYSTRNAVRLS